MTQIARKTRIFKTVRLVRVGNVLVAKNCVKKASLSVRNLKQKKAVHVFRKESGVLVARACVAHPGQTNGSGALVSQNGVEHNLKNGSLCTGCRASDSLSSHNVRLCR